VGWWAGDSIIGAVYRLCVWKLQTLPHPLHGRLGVWVRRLERQDEALTVCFNSQPPQGGRPLIEPVVVFSGD
jgi:hypothetical protein